MRKPEPAPKLEDLLPELMAQGIVSPKDSELEAVIRDAQSSYRHWDKVRRVAAEHQVNPRLAWAFIKFMRLPVQHATPFRSSANDPVTFSIPGTVQHEIMLIDQQLAGQITLEPELRLSAEKERFIAAALMEEAIASSMLEGAATTVRVAKEMLRTGRKPRTTGERMVVNNYRAIELIRDNLKQRMSPEFLLELQNTLTRDTLELPDQCGRFRKADEDIVVGDRYGELLHVPPPAEQLSDRLKRFCHFANAPTVADDGAFIHPFIRATLLHFQLGYDHPFCDGNGRTARAIFYWSMLRAGYWLFEFLPISRLIYKSPAKYGQAYLYTETDGFDATYFLVYHARILRQARSDLRNHIVEKQRELAEARVVFKRDPDLNHRQHELLMHAIQHPDAVYTIEGHQRSQGIVYATARADLLSLAQRGYLIRISRGRRMEFVPGKKMAAARRRSR